MEYYKIEPKNAKQFSASVLYLIKDIATAKALRNAITRRGNGTLIVHAEKRDPFYAAAIEYGEPLDRKTFYEPTEY